MKPTKVLNCPNCDAVFTGKENAETERLDPGGWARYEVALFFAQHPARCSHHVSGRPVQ